jgi:hypothetical protein
MTQRIVMMWLLLVVLMLIHVILITTHVVTDVAIVTILMVILRFWRFSVRLVQDDIMQGIGERAFMRQCRLAASEFDP